MDGESSWQYYAAIVASGLSVLGWIGALVAGFYTLYLVATGGPAGTYATVVIVAAVAGAVFAKVEKQLYRVDDGQ